MTNYIKLKYCIKCLWTCDGTNSHCPIYAVSDPKCDKLSQKCKELHNKSCSDCCNILEIFSQIKQFCDKELNQELKEDLLYDINTIEEDIGLYMKHIIWDCQQEKAKQDVLEHLGNNNIFWIKEWSQKILPQKFREPQQDYFGKKEMSQHVDVIYLKQDNELKKYIYFTLLQKCEENLAHTLSLTDHVCQPIKTDFSNVKNVYKKSDNAGCYAGNGYLLGQYHILKERDLTLIRHDFNEPHKG